MIVDATRVVTTKGTHPGEEGTGYRWGQEAPMGDFSAESRGVFQGYREPCRIEILVPGAEVRNLKGYGLHLCLPDPICGNPLTAQEALIRGYARVVKETHGSND